MIKNIQSTSNHLAINTNPASYVSANPNSGALRFNTITQTLEVFDGYNWISFSSYTTIDLTVTAQSAIDWAIKKMTREQEYAILASQYSSVQDALDNLVKAQERLDIIVALTKKEESHA
jgi:hypothetical protein